MPYKILGTGEGAETLARALDAECVSPHDMTNRNRKELYDNNHVINWGWSTKWAHINPMDEAVRRIKNKKHASDMMIAADVNAVPYLLHIDVTVLPILRRNATHSQGRDIRIIRRAAEVRPGNYYVPIFAKTKEYRVHVFRGEVIKLQEKIPGNYDEIVWNNDAAEFKRRALDNPIYDRTKEIAISAVQALGLDFGAVDVGWREDGNIVIVFEVNTAPSINDNTAACYAEKIRAALTPEREFSILFSDPVNVRVSARDADHAREVFRRDYNADGQDRTILQVR